MPTPDSTNRRPREIDWQEVAARTLHPNQRAILERLRDGEASPIELAKELEMDVKLGTIAYHTRRLLTLGLLEPTKTVPRRGATEHFYQLAPAAIEHGER